MLSWWLELKNLLNDLCLILVKILKSVKSKSDVTKL